MKGNKVTSFFNFLDVFENKKNFRNTLMLVAIASILGLLSQVSVVTNLTSVNPLMYFIIPVIYIALVFINVLLSALIIQFTWIKRVNYGFSAQFVALVEVMISISAVCLPLIMSSFGMDKTDATKISSIIFFFLILISSYVNAFYTVKRNHQTKIESEATTDDESFDLDPFEEAESYQKEVKNFSFERSIFISFIGNFIRSTIVAFVKLYLIMGFVMLG